MKYLLMILIAIFLVGCNGGIHSITKNGDQYIMSGTSEGSGGDHGFVWIGEYDPETNTMIIIEEHNN